MSTKPPGAEVEVLLPRVLATWVSTRHSRLGDAIDRLAAVLPSLPALPVTRRKSDLEAWATLEAQGEWRDFPRLMVAARAGQQADVLRQVKALARRQDARFAAGLLALLEAPPYAGVGSRPLLTSVIQLLVASRDRRAAGAARELASRYIGIVDSSTGAMVVEQLNQAATCLEALVEPSLAAAAVRLCEKAERLAPAILRSQPAVTPDSVDALMAMVVESPDNDEPRRVLADALIEAGDGRGHFIRDQLDGLPGDDTKLDVQRWLQPLKMAGRVTCARGFPVSVAVYKSAEKSASLPQWQTVREVSDLQKLSAKATLSLLDSPMTKNFRNVQPLSSTVFEALAKTPRPWAKLVTGLAKPVEASLSYFRQLEDLTINLAVAPPERFFVPTPRLAHLALNVAAEPIPPGLLEPLTQLRTLKLAGKCEGLRLPPSLEVVTVVADVVAADWSRCANLHTLRCHARALESGPSIPSLRSLELSTQGEARLEGVSGLKHLALRRGSRVARELLVPLRSLLSLELGYAKDFSLAHLTGLSELVHLGGVWGTWQTLPHLPELRSFDCMAPPTCEPLRELLHRAPQLELLSLTWNSSSNLYFYGDDFARARRGWAQLAALLRDSQVRVVDFQTVALVREVGAAWRAVPRSMFPGPGHLEVEKGPLQVMNGQRS